MTFKPVRVIKSHDTYPPDNSARNRKAQKSQCSEDLMLQFQRSLRRKIKAVASSSQLQNLETIDEHIGTTSVERKSKEIIQCSVFPKIGQASLGRSDEDDDGYIVVPARSRVQHSSFPRIGQVSLGHSDEDDDGYISVVPMRIRESGLVEPARAQRLRSALSTTGSLKVPTLQIYCCSVTKGTDFLT